MALEEISREKVRDYLVKVKLYQSFVLVFVCMGIIIFAVFYYKFMDGDFVQALTNPMTAIVLGAAFLPTIIFSWYVKQLEKTLRKMMRRLEEKR